LDEKVGALAEGLKIFKVKEPMSGTKMTPLSLSSFDWTRKGGPWLRDSRFSR
jgi:hypothetical protein